MTTIKQLIIATALATTLGPVSIYAMDQEQEQEEWPSDFFNLPPIVRQVCCSNETELIRAIKAGDSIAVLKLITDNPSLINKEVYPHPLYIACQKGSAEIVQILLEGGADANQADEHDRTPLIAACSSGHTEIVRILVAAGADVNQADVDDRTPLRLAALIGNAEIVKILVFNGAIPSGYVPTEAMKEVIRQAQEARRNVGEDQDWLLQELLASEAFALSLPVAALRGLVGDYVNPAGVEDEQLSQLIKEQIVKNRTKRRAQKSAAAQSSEAVQGKRVEVGIDPQAMDVQASGQLMAAVQENNSVLVRRALCAGAKVNQAGVFCYTPLIVASQCGYVEVVGILIEAKAEVNQAHKDGDTSLMVASRYGHADVAGMLIEAGAQF